MAEKEIFEIAVIVSGKKYRCTVEGRRVKFKGFEDYTFFVHRAFRPSGEHVARDWDVSEAATGMAITVTGDWRYHEAIQNARVKLAGAGPEKFAAIQSQCRKIEDYPELETYPALEANYV